MIETNNIEGAPAAVGPYSHVAITTGRTAFLSGQIALLPDGTMVGEDAAEQTVQVFKNIETVLSGIGASLDCVVKATVLLASMDDFAAVNEVYAKAFGSHRPARSAFAVRTLPKNALVEIEVIASLD